LQLRNCWRNSVAETFVGVTEIEGKPRFLRA
jgi:hypothetical protein